MSHSLSNMILPDSKGENSKNGEHYIPKRFILLAGIGLLFLCFITSLKASDYNNDPGGFIFFSEHPPLNATSDINGDGILNNDGGNGRLFNYYQEENLIEFTPERTRGNSEQPLYFYIKITDYDETRDLKIKVMWFLRKANGSTWAPKYARWSYDQENWYNTLLKTEIFVDNKGYPEYIIPKEQLTGDTLFFAHGYIRTYDQWNEYIARLQQNYPDYLSVSELCKSDEYDLSVKLLRISDNNISDQGKKLIWIISRQHSFEVQNDVVMKGMIDYMLDSSNPDAVYLRENAITYIVPLVDSDAAHSGSPGKKDEAPDFNRVWDQSTSNWRAVQAIKNLSLATALNNKLEIFFDFHNPYPEQDRLEILHRFPTGEARVPLNNFRAYFRLHQSSRNGYQINQVGSNSTSKITAGGWSHFNLNPSIAGTFEIGWDKDEYGNQFNWEGYISAGESFVVAMSNSIKDLKTTNPPDPPDPLEGLLNVSFKVIDKATGNPVIRPNISYNGNAPQLMSSNGELTLQIDSLENFVFEINHNSYFIFVDSFSLESDTLLIIPLTRKLANLTFSITDNTGVTGTPTVTAGWPLMANSQGMVYFTNLPARSIVNYSVHKQGIEPLLGSLFLELDTTLHIMLAPVGTSFVSKPQISIHPNPARDILIVDFSDLPAGKAIVEIYDISGRHILTKRLEGLNEIDISGFIKGVYFIIIETLEYKSTRKIIIS